MIITITIAIIQIIINTYIYIYISTNAASAKSCVEAHDALLYGQSEACMDAYVDRNCNIKSHRIASYHIISHHVISCNISPQHATSYHMTGCATYEYTPSVSAEKRTITQIRVRTQACMSPNI